MLHRGDVVGNTYQIIGEIGSGGTGVIYKAYHMRLQRYVVVKRIKDEVISRVNIRAEADILKRLKHTYLPQVFDFLQVEEGVYTVIDFIEGQPLDFYIKNHYQIHQKQLIKWACQLCEALEYLHAQTPPIYHSDIKPQNIMITPTGDVCLIDFNVSLDGRSSSQISGLSAGYAPPEQYFNAGPIPPNMGPNTYRFQMNTPLDARSDIYSLGATLYHLVTGVRPERSTQQVKPVTEYQVPYSQSLLEVIDKMMQPDPNDRYQTAHEVLEVLRNLRKLDKAYISHRRAGHVTTIVFSVLMALSLAVSGFGYYYMGVEKEERYQGLVLEGTTFGDSGDYETAMARYDEAINLFSSKLPAYYQKLLAYVRMGNYEGCINYGKLILTNPVLKKAMEEDPDGAADIYFMIGNAWFETGHYDDAIGYYKEAVSRSNKNPDYYRDYSIAEARNGNTAEAKKLLEQAVSIGLNSHSAAMVSAELNLAEGKLSEARDGFEKIIKTTEDETLRRRAYLLLARAYRQDGDTEGEIEVLLKARDVFPAGTNGPVLLALGNAYQRMAFAEGSDVKAMAQKALECYELAQKQGDNSPNLKYNMAAVLQLSEDYDRAETILKELQTQSPEDYRSYMRLAILYGTRENAKDEADRDYTPVRLNYEKAVAYYQKAKQNGVSDPEMQVLETMMQQIIDGGWLYVK